MEKCVSISHVFKAFDGIKALQDISTEIKIGELRAFLGPNGAGKTTLMRILTTQIRPTSGDAMVMGYSVTKEAKKVRMLIGYVPQEFSVWTDLTGYENMMIYAKLYGMERDKLKRAVEDMLDFMELREAGNRLVKTYSGGMIRRLEMGIALLVKPKVIFLDEPTIGLDPRARELVWSRLLEYKKEYGATVIFNTHYMDEAERFAEKVTVINKGRLVAEGSPQDLIEVVGGGDLISLEIKSDLSHALNVLSPMEGIELVSSKNPLILRVENAESIVSTIIGILIKQGVQVGEVRIRKPTLEDVFIKLTGTSFEEAEAAGYREALAMRGAIRRGG